MHPSVYAPCCPQGGTILVHARLPVSGVDDIQRRYCARKLARYGPVRDTALVYPTVYAPCGPKRGTTLVHARCPVSGVDDIQCRYWARKLTGYGPVRPSNEVLHSCTHRYSPRAARNEVLHSCALDVLPRASMTYRVDTARLN